MKTRKRSRNKAGWSTTQYSNLIRYIPSGKYFARIRVQGKLIRKSLKTDRISVAKLRLADFEKEERRNVESRAAATSGKMTFGEAVSTFRERLKADMHLKPRSRITGRSASRLLSGQPECRDSLLRHRSFRAGNSRERNCRQSPDVSEADQAVRD